MKKLLFPVGLSLAMGALCAAQVIPSRVSSAAHDLDDAGAAFFAHVSTNYASNTALVLGAKNVADAADTLHTTLHDVNNNQAPVSQIPCDHNVLYRAITRMPELDALKGDPVAKRGWSEINRMFGVVTRGLLAANLSYIVPRVPAHGLDTAATDLDNYLQLNYTGAQYQSLLAASIAFQAEADDFHDLYHDVENCRNNKTPQDIPAAYQKLTAAAATLVAELMQSGVWQSDREARKMTIGAAVIYLKLSATLRAFRFI